MLPCIFQVTYDILTRLGGFLRRFHKRYAAGGELLEHGDVQPSNIFFEESSGKFTLIDIGGMGQKTAESDVST